MNTTSIEIDGVWYTVDCFPTFPVGIGEAADIAKRECWGLPTPYMVDKLYAIAMVTILPKLRPNDGTPRTMSTPAVYEDQARKVIAAYTNKRKSIEASMGPLSDQCVYMGSHKVVVRDPETGKPGLYGWHVPLDIEWDKTPLHPCADPGLPCKVVQPIYTGHELGWKDYSQSMVRFRRI